jgi:hypothetical protein
MPNLFSFVTKEEIYLELKRRRLEWYVSKCPRLKEVKRSGTMVLVVD